MKYRVKFPSLSVESKFKTALSLISQLGIQDRIMDGIAMFANNPRPFGRKLFKQLKPPIQFYQLTAQYRIRIGDYRVLYDVDDKKRIVWILVLRKRSERTYR